MRSEKSRKDKDMSEKIQLRGWLAASQNLKIASLGEYMDLGVCVQYRNLLSKFPADQIFLSDTEQVCFLDGYVYNKEDFIRPEGYHEWSDSFAFSLREDRKKHLSKLRGAFCGYHYEKETDRITVYTDQVSNKAVYYYCRNDRWILSDCLEYAVRVLRENGIAYHFNRKAAEYMLSYGYMPDDSTQIEEIRRLLPGCLAVIEHGSVKVERYHSIRNQEEEMTEKEAVEKVDKAFREAIRREFEKDREYSYRHLVDLSGGLDSRMVSWVAHDMGYTDQVNMAYSRAGYLDERISRRIANDLGHEYRFMPLDDARWLYDIDRNVRQNNGAALYSGITGGGRFLETLKADCFGIEHTGMIGDAILSTFYHDRDFNYGKPKLGLHRYSERLHYTFDEKILKDYPCQEMFAIYTRGILGAQSSYMIRQHYVETASPFMDVDFLDAVFSVPFEYRNRHHLYLLWMKEKYPKAADYGWEKWGGVKPKESHLFLRKVRTAERLAKQSVCRLLHRQNTDSMNPMDAWYAKDAEIQRYFETYFESVIDCKVFDEELRRDLTEMFRQGNVTEKSMALTVLAAVKQYFM